jgi:hypothetical protein
MFFINIIKVKKLKIGGGMKNQHNKKPPQLVTASELAKIFPGLCTSTLAAWRHQGRGPDYYRVYRKIFYDVDEVRLFLTASPIKNAEDGGTPK